MCLFFFISVSPSAVCELIEDHHPVWFPFSLEVSSGSMERDRIATLAGSESFGKTGPPPSK